MDVDWEQGTVTVNEVQMWVGGELVVKGPRPRVAYAPSRPCVARWTPSRTSTIRAERAGEPVLATDRLFTSPTGKPVLDHTLWRVINRARLAAGLPRFRPYDLRHSHASILIELGAHPKMISERMGHTEIGVTMNVYGHLFSGAQHRLTETSTPSSSAPVPKQRKSDEPQPLAQSGGEAQNQRVRHRE